MKCLCCGAAKQIFDISDVPHIHSSETAINPTVASEFFFSMSEVVLNCEFGDRYRELLGQFQR